MTGAFISQEIGSVLVVLATLAVILSAVYARRQDKRALEEAQAMNVALAERVRALEGLTLAIPGVDQGEKSWTITVDSKEVQLKALPPLEYARALEELPSFLFAYASREVKGESLSAEQLEEIVFKAKRWILACARDREEVESRLGRLSVPEALSAVVAISRFNGLGEQLTAFFQGRLEHFDARPGGEALRNDAQPPS